MDLYVIRTATEGNIDEIVKIYNSNNKFLNHHLGVEYIDRGFVIKEMSEMREEKFLSCVIEEKQTGEIIGIIDYKPDNIVYLSLIMINAEYQGNGTGTWIYKMFEEKMMKESKQKIRIDVVNNYKDNLVKFWRYVGFIDKNEVELTWGDKHSTAIVMTKKLK